MSLHTVTIQLPETVYQKLARLASQQNRSVADVVATAVDRIEPFVGISADEVRELDALTYLSDDSLWGLAQRVLTPEQQAEWDQLNDKLQRSGDLDSAEERRGQELLAQYDYVVLRRAVALHVLQERGHDVTSLLTVPSGPTPD